MTNFEGTERSAAISRDGRFVAFRSDREGPLDVWVTQIGTGEFFNVTKGIDDEYAIDTRAAVSRMAPKFGSAAVWGGGCGFCL